MAPRFQIVTFELLAVDEDAALTGVIEAGQKLDNGGLARSIFPNLRTTSPGLTGKLTPVNTEVPSG